MLILLSFLFELLLLLQSVSGRNLNVWNYCETTIWPAYGSTAASSTASFGGWRADPSTPRVLNLADDWEGYIWARHCEFPESDSCKTGACDGGLECTGLGSSPPAATLVELSFQGGSSYTFDINISKRFDIPVAVENSNCVANLSCSLNFAASCPPALQVVKDDSGAALSCAVNSQSQSWFTSLCPMATVDPDSPVTQQICGAGDIDIQFCPQTNNGPAPNPPTIPPNNPAPPVISHPPSPSPPQPPSSGGGGNMTSTPPINAEPGPAANLRGSGNSGSTSSSTSRATSSSHTSSSTISLPESTIFLSSTQSASQLADQPTQSPSEAINNKGRSSPGLIIGIILGTLLPILLVGLTIFFFCRRRRQLREVTGARAPISISSDTASIASFGDVRFETSTDNLLQRSNCPPLSIARSQHNSAPPPGASALFPPEKRASSTEHVHSISRESDTVFRQHNHENPFLDPTEIPTQEEYVVPNVDLSRLYEDDRALDLALVEYLSRRVESYHPPTPPSYKTQPDHGA